MDVRIGELGRADMFFTSVYTYTNKHSQKFEIYISSGMRKREGTKGNEVKPLRTCWQYAYGILNRCAITTTVIVSTKI